MLLELIQGLPATLRSYTEKMPTAKPEVYVNLQLRRRCLLPLHCSLAELEEERREKSERASAELKLQIEALGESFNEQDRLLFSTIGALSLRNAEAKTHYQQLIQNLQKQLQAAERDVGRAVKRT